LSGDVKGVVLLDVTPLSLGLETMGGVFTKLIERNTTIPTRKEEVFSTASDGQNAVSVNIFQGEREIASHNKKLGDFELSGIMPAPRGVPKIKVAFDIDANGILSVTAKDEGTNKEAKITVTGSSSLSKDEVERMVQEAVEFAEEDKKQKEKIERHNSADGLVYSVEKSMNDLGEKVTEEEKTVIGEKITALKEVMESEDEEAFTTALNELQAKAFELSQRIYEQSQENQPSTDENVVDAEIVEPEVVEDSPQG
jgi:molecular chaperone DnaK